MTPAVMGGLAGVVIGIVGFAVLRLVADRLEANKTVSGRDPRADLVRAIAWADLAILPVLGYVAGALVSS